MEVAVGSVRVWGFFFYCLALTINISGTESLNADLKVQLNPRKAEATETL